MILIFCIFFIITRTLWQTEKCCARYGENSQIREKMFCETLKEEAAPHEAPDHNPANPVRTVRLHLHLHVHALPLPHAVSIPESETFRKNNIPFRKNNIWHSGLLIARHIQQVQSIWTSGSFVNIWFFSQSIFFCQRKKIFVVFS